MTDDRWQAAWRDPNGDEWTTDVYSIEDDWVPCWANVTVEFKPRDVAERLEGVNDDR